jgi:hypothetical protein
MRHGAEAPDVIVVRTLGAKLQRAGGERRSLSRRRPSRAEQGEEAEPVSVTRVTVVRGQPLEDIEAARDWLARCEKTAVADAEVAEALAILNRAIHAHRLAAADPYAGDVSLARARRIRLGYGAGHDVVDGRWRDAYSVPPQVTSLSRRRMLAPEEPLAQILGGRRPTYPSEELLLRARLDLDQGRSREAALQARAAHAALEAELESETSLGQASKAMKEEGGPLGNLASAAVAGALGEDEVARLEEIVVAMERIARRRRHLPGES